MCADVDTMIVRSLFGHNVGAVLSTHTCSYRRQSGRLYISSTHLAFYSTMFGFERKIMIRIADIKYAGLVRTTSIACRSQCANDCDDESKDTFEEHVFRSFSDRESVLCIILDACKKIMGAYPESNQNSLEDSILRREDETAFTTPLRNVMTRPPALSMGEESRLYLDAEDNISHDSPGVNPLDLLVGRDDSGSGGQPKSLEKQNASTMKIDLHKEWNGIMEISRNMFTEVAVEKTILPMQLTEFFATFIADQAPRSMSTFQETIIKDSNVQCTPWENESPHSTVEGYEKYNRVITSIHQRKARIGPSSVPLERQQTYRKYASHGIVLNTVLNMEGVPYGDTFEIRDEWIIEAQDENVEISVFFRIHFINPPIAMVRKTIVAQSKKEVSTWFNLYMERFVHSNGLVDDKTMVERPAKSNGRNWVAWLLRSDWLTDLNICVIFLSITLFYTLSLRHRVDMLEIELHQVKAVNERIIQQLLDRLIAEDQSTE